MEQELATSHMCEAVEKQTRPLKFLDRANLLEQRTRLCAVSEQVQGPCQNPFFGVKKLKNKDALREINAFYSASGCGTGSVAQCAAMRSNSVSYPNPKQRNSSSFVIGVKMNNGLSKFVSERIVK